MLLNELLIKPKKKKTPTKKVLKEYYEAGELSYEDAWAKIKQQTPKDELFFWEMELGSARDLKDDPTSPMTNASHITQTHSKMKH